MIDAKQLRSDSDGIRAALARRGAGELVEDFLKLDEEHRRLLTDVEQVRAERNTAAKAIAEAKQRGDDTSIPIARQSALKAQQAEEEQRLAEVQQRMAEVMMQ